MGSLHADPRRPLFALLAAVFLVGVLASCQQPPPRAPEECKVTTDPEACRKAYEHR